MEGSLKRETTVYSLGIIHTNLINQRNIIQLINVSNFIELGQ